jgi:murein DD-endopeptidase MepM/ murein hydrolase activator NlpD
MKKTYWYIAGGIFLTYLIMGTNKAFGKVTEDNIRRGCDQNWGCGSFGANRGTRKHNGLDIKTTVGQNILSPISGKVTRFPFPYGSDLTYTGIEIVNDQYKVKIFYMKASVSANTNVVKGQVIGKAQNIAAKYSSTMTNHIHVEVYDKKTNALINPETLF